MPKPLFRLTGHPALARALRAAGSRADKRAGMALFQEGKGIMEQSGREVPVDRGWLQESGQVIGPQRRGGTVTVILSYGDGRVSYEVPVHERLDVNHPHGKAKFLEDPLKAAESGMENRLARRIGGAFA